MLESQQYKLDSQSFQNQDSYSSSSVQNSKLSILENEYAWVQVTIAKSDGLTVSPKFSKPTFIPSFHVQSQQNDEPIDYEKLLEAMTQVQIAHNYEIDIMVKILHSHPLTIPNCH